MLGSKEIPSSFLENINMVNTATNFFNTNNKGISDINTLYNRTTNDFSPFNTNNNYNNYNNYNTTKLNTLNLNNKEINAMNEKKRFLWKEINTLNYNEINTDEKVLENPVIKNILNSNINENEIQNMPENYLVNLIHTLQNLANNAIKNNNFLENENKQLYHDLEMMKTNNEYLSQKNIKINQKLNILNKQRNEEKKTMHDLFEENNNNYNFLRTKKYYCEICTNKKFKSQKYLDEHIARRHPDYINKRLKQKNKKENKLNIELYQKKLNDMKNYFDNLIYKSIKKIQYIKINEKLNSLQNLYEMGKYFNNINNNNITNININNSSYQEEINIENNSEINTNNLNNNINTNLNNNIMEEKEKEKKTETENSGSMEKTEENSKRKQNDLMEKNHGNFIHNCLLLKKKMKFIKIKKFFEPKPEDQIIQQRSKKKRKTQKNTSKLVPDSEEPSKEENKKLEFNEEKIEQNEDDKNILKTKNEKNLEENKKEEEDNININNNKENIITKENLEENKEQELTHNEKLDLKLKEETVINFSDEEEEKNRVLKQFCLDFKSRDSNLSLLQERYYLKKVLPKDYNLDKKKVDEIIKEKINKKLGDFNPREKTIQQMRSKMMKIYYEVVDLKDKNDDMYLYSYLNISNFLNLQDLIRDANNNNFLLEASFFENVSYKVEENNSEFYNEDESQQNNNEASNDFSFKMN